MHPFFVRWLNLRGFEDTGWQRIRPLTVVIGANASGKTSLIAPLLLLKQTLESRDSTLALSTQGDLFNAGSFRNIIYNHDVGRELGLQFRFHPPPKGDGQKPAPGDLPPGTLELAFTFAGDERPPNLSSFTVRDDFGRIMMQRKLLKSGNYSIRKLPHKLSGGDFSRAIRKSQPYHFLFSVDDVFRRTYRREFSRQGSREVRDFEVNEPESFYFAVLSHISSHVRGLVHSISYLGPLRARPQRLYEVASEKPLDVGTRGEHAPEILFREDENFLNLVNEWVAQFGFGVRLVCKKATEGAFGIILQRTQKSPEINLADTGFGLSQVLPLIVQGLYAKEDVIVAEQPEIHLNPKLQARLADLFAEVTNRKNTVLVETHSEHFVLRLRRLIAEKRIKAKDVAIFYTERRGDASSLREISVKVNGHIEPTEWPRGFFEDSLAESLALATAQAREADA